MSIALPESVASIDEYAFFDCTALDAPSRERIRAICPHSYFEAGSRTGFLPAHPGYIMLAAEVI